MIQTKPEEEMHWYDRRKMGYRTLPPPEWELGDQMADHSDDQGYDSWGEDNE